MHEREREREREKEKKKKKKRRSAREGGGQGNEGPRKKQPVESLQEPCSMDKLEAMKKAFTPRKVG